MAMDPGVHELARAGYRYPCHLPPTRGVRRAETDAASKYRYNSAAPTYLPTYLHLLIFKDSTAVTGAWRDAALALAPAANAM
jgi:hypothetical protein